jgi:hypothetical protein
VRAKVAQKLHLSSIETIRGRKTMQLSNYGGYAHFDCLKGIALKERNIISRTITSSVANNNCPCHVDELDTRREDPHHSS